MRSVRVAMTTWQAGALAGTAQGELLERAVAALEHRQERMAVCVWRSFAVRLGSARVALRAKALRLVSGSRNFQLSMTAAASALR